jgi:MoxR-vWA-beta-propeller ternary system domain bpX5
MTALPLTWGARWPPLAPECVVVHGSSARALARTLADTPQRLKAWRAVVAGDALVLTGPELPWADGACYFGRDAGASWLLVPTTQAPSVPIAWLERRYRAAHLELDWPCVLLPEPLTVIPVGRAAPLDPARLAAWSVAPP